MNIRFDGQVVLVTGATSGIGRAVAVRFVKSGARVMATGRNVDALNVLKEELTNGLEPEAIEVMAGDVTDDGFRRQLVEKTVARFERLDVLVNAAGFIASGTIENTSLEDYDRMMDVNVRSVFHLTQLAVPHLETTKGNIVNVSSVTGLRAFPGILSYCVSKAGVDQLTRCVALELAAKGIRVNAVNPGVVVTNLHRNSGMQEDAYARFLEHSKTTHPMGRVGESREVADLIAFLASKEAGWITGDTVSIDGGRHQTCAR